MAAQLVSLKPVDVLVEMQEVLSDLRTPNRLARAELETSRLRKLREEKAAERRTLIHENFSDRSGTSRMREIDAATAAMREVDKLLGAALTEMQVARKLFEPQVQAALEPYRVAAAEAALRALNELDAAARVLLGARSIASRRGANLPYDITVPNFVALRRCLSLLVDGGDPWQ